MSEKSKIWLSSPHMGGEEMFFVEEAFRTNWIAPLGPNVEGFEEDLKSFLKQDIQIAALSSGTAALHLALVLLGVGRGDEVICQSMTFSASANPIVYQGATPVFVDSEPETWNICPDSLENAIKDRLSKGKRIKAIIAVNLYGMPYKADAIRQIADQYEIPIVEDAAESLGSKYKGQRAGTFGDLGILSFNGNKIITTSGGGALICPSKAKKKKAIFLATQARDDAPHYQHSHIGYNYRMSNVTAGIGRGQMKVLEGHIDKRRKMNQFYRNQFSTIDGVSVFEEPTQDYFSNHWLSCIQLEQTALPMGREEVRQIFLRENIETRPLWKPMHLQPIFKDCPFFGDNNISERLFANGLCLPSGSNLSDTDRERISLVISQNLR